MANTVISFEGFGFTHPGATAPVLCDLNLGIAEGDLCLVIGRTGSGKSTLLQAINALVPHFTGGTMAGQVLVDGRSTRTHRPRDLADVVGFVPQNPANGFVTDVVEDEIAYGMEQLGLAPQAMRKRVEETLDLLGIADLRRRGPTELSGGQQQRVAIASVLAAQPRIVVLDEPSSALDPTAAQDVLSALTTLVHEVGLTVVLAEHRLERVMADADTLVWLPGDGRAIAGPPATVLAESDVVPPLSALARQLHWPTVPLTVRQARRALATSPAPNVVPQPQQPTTSEPVLEVQHLSVRYDRLVAVDDVTLSASRGESIALMGRNGAGKSSLLWALQGALPSTGRTNARGTISVDGIDPRDCPPARVRQSIAMVPQEAADLLYLGTVAEELAQADAESGVASGSSAALLGRLGIELPGDRNPRDLSEGQRLALVLAIQLVAEPAVLLLDEPTRGLDYTMKAELAAIIDRLTAEGTCVITSTHDVEFAARTSHRTIVMGDGQVVADGPSRQVVTSSPAYAPQVSKVFFPRPVLLPSDVQPGDVQPSAPSSDSVAEGAGR